jgi:hypothetical protein
MKVYEIAYINYDEGWSQTVWVASEYPITIKDNPQSIKEIDIDPNDPGVDFVIEAKGDKNAKGKRGD